MMHLFEYIWLRIHSAIISTGLLLLFCGPSPIRANEMNSEWLLAMEQATQLMAEPALYYHFLRWEGNVPAEDEEGNPLTLWVDGPQSVTARFGADVTENTGTPHWWLAKYRLTNDTFEVEALKRRGAPQSVRSKKSPPEGGLF